MTLGLPDNATLEQARAWLQRNLPDGVECPCCDQHAKIYKRPLNSSMAYVLMLLYREAIDQGKASWVHVPSFIATKTTGQPELAAAVRGDWAKLRYWGLIEEYDDAIHDVGKTVMAPHAGIWRITARGIRFGSGGLAIPAHVYLYNGELVEVPGTLQRPTELTDIKTALGTAFSWREIMERAS